jgi:very-short-patch-repair endonuclease
MGPYILDFYCVEARLCVEVDGEHHRVQAAADARRDAFLRSQGVETLRYSASEVTTNTDGVAVHIQRIAQERIAILAK